MIPGPRPLVRVVLACTACELVYEPELADFESGNTGCPRCGGWTWFAQLGTTEWSARTSTDRGGYPPQAFESTCPDPAVAPPRPAAGSGFPTTLR